MPRKSPYPIVLSPNEREALESMARSYTAPYCDVVRAKAILLAAKGLSNKEIAQRIDMGRQNVSKWRKRFFEERRAGLSDLARRGCPRSFSPQDYGGNQGDGM